MGYLVDLTTKSMRRNANEDYIGSSQDKRYLEYVKDLPLNSQNGIPCDIIPRSEAADHFEKNYMKK